MKIKGVIFDKDDTLIDLCEFWYTPCRETAKHVLEMCGLEKSDCNIEKIMTACGFDSDAKLIPASPMQSGTNEDVIDAFAEKAKALGGKLPCDMHNIAFDFFHDSLIRFGKAVPVNGVDKVLRELKNKGFKLCVVTLDEYAITRHCLEQLNVFELFDTVICADTVENPKPAPDAAYRFCKEFGLSPDEVIMVGDAQKDMIFAKRAGIHGVLFDPHDRFEKSSGEFVINNMKDVIKIAERYPDVD